MSLEWLGFSKVDPDLVKVEQNESDEKYTRRQKAALHAGMISTSRENAQLKALVLILCVVVFFLAVINEQHKEDVRSSRLASL